MQTDGCVCVILYPCAFFFLFFFGIVIHWLSDIYCDPDSISNDTDSDTIII